MARADAAVELELKFALDPAQVRRLRRAAALRGAAPAVVVLDTLYLDTPGCELAAAQMALRLRHDGTRWIEGLKAGRSGTGGLHRRREWEFERAGPGIDLSLYAGTPLAGLPGAATLHERLRPAFRVFMQRTAWRLEEKGAALEVALDEGRIEAEGRAEPLCEVEIECLGGDPAAVFDLAARLLEEVPMRPSAVSKAQRGYRLFRAEGLRPAKARPVRLAASDTIDEAARQVVAAGLDQLQANEDGLLASDDPEFVHQARVALRRLRAALRMFRDAIGRRRAQRWRERLGEIARALGEARDWDVFATETLPPVLEAFRGAGGEAVAEAVAARRAAAREAARRTLGSRAYALVLLEISRWLCSAPRQPAAEALRGFALRLLRKRHDRLLAEARRLEAMRPGERHRLRIDAKRLRYGTDALASVLEPRRVARYLAALRDLQDALGAANDMANAPRLLGAVDAPQALRAFARRRFRRGAAPDTRRLLGILARLDADRPWRGAKPGPA